MGRKLLATAKSNPGMVIDATKLGAPRAVNPPSSKVTAAPGTVKPDFPKQVNIMTVPNPASGLIAAATTADKVLPTNQMTAGFLDTIPDIPGTQLDNKLKSWINAHPVVAAALFGVAAAGAGAAVTYGVMKPSSKKKKKSKKKKSTKRKSTKRKTSKAKPRSSKKRTRKSGYGSAKAYNRKGGKKVYKTKNGQPYILLASGKARFIKK